MTFLPVPKITKASHFRLQRYAAAAKAANAEYTKSGSWTAAERAFDETHNAFKARVVSLTMEPTNFAKL